MKEYVHSNTFGCVIGFMMYIPHFNHRILVTRHGYRDVLSDSWDFQIPRWSIRRALPCHHEAQGL